MLHSHLTTLNAVSLVLNTFKAQGLSSDALLAGSGISAADLSPRRHAHHHQSGNAGLRQRRGPQA